LTLIRRNTGCNSAVGSRAASWAGKVWKRDDVIERLSVTDDPLWNYAARLG
jgi:hypothetical protein